MDRLSLVFVKRSRSFRELSVATLTVLSLSLLVAQIPAANAIFGLSACEKAKSSINSHDAVGYELWKTYETTWKQHIKNPKITDINIQVVEEITNLYNSDLTIYALAIKHANCFNPAQNSSIITSQTETKLSLSHAQSWMAATTSNNWDGFWTTDYYSGYIYLLKSLKSVK